MRQMQEAHAHLTELGFQYDFGKVSVCVSVWAWCGCGVGVVWAWCGRVRQGDDYGYLCGCVRVVYAYVCAFGALHARTHK